MERDGETKNPPPSDLHRVRTLRHAGAICVGSLLGSGIFVLPGLAARIAGPASIISWILLSLASYPFAYTFAKLSARNPESGGIYAFAREGLGRGASAATARSEERRVGKERRARGGEYRWRERRKQ